MNPCLPCLLLGNPSVMPAPGSVTYLGTLVQLSHEMPDGQVVLHEWDLDKSPPLFWNDGQRALFAFPSMAGLPTGLREPRHADRAAVDAFRRWNAGREPRGVSEARVSKVNMRKAGAAKHIRYWSNKFGETEDEWTEYIHPFEVGVSADLGPGSPPAAFYVAGGRLRLTPRGLEG